MNSCKTCGKEFELTFPGTNLQKYCDLFCYEIGKNGMTKEEADQQRRECEKEFGFSMNPIEEK